MTYYVLSELEPHEVRDKEIEFSGFPNKNKVKITTTLSANRFNLFEEKKPWISTLFN